ncbi:hypothetical protein NDU88_002017 [Pleurodeles waltl]|uniref:Uncharacterized protein n=1 Tax=Pleurodeles waltl TaxID=8319 RepID=A0AAV7SE97_PLEWA|nr:hypothetical protein NDU88_002017 [Pleurodeles waltl]
MPISYLLRRGTAIRRVVVCAPQRSGAVVIIEAAASITGAGHVSFVCLLVPGSSVRALYGSVPGPLALGAPAVNLLHSRSPIVSVSQRRTELFR